MTRSPAYRAVLFDLDGTLADTIGLIVQSYDHALASVIGQTRTPEQIKEWIGRPLLQTFEEVDPVNAGELDRVYREWNLANTDRLTAEYAGVPDLLRALADAGVTTGVVTSKRRQTAEKVMVAVGIADLVPLAGTLEDTTDHKPNPAPLLHGASVLGVDPAQSAYVGDAVVDVLAARAAGMGSVAVSWGAGRREALAAAEPDHLLDAVADLDHVLLPPVTESAATRPAAT